MTKSIRVNEYYSLFNIHSDIFDAVKVPDSIKPSNEYNSFRGFSNWKNFQENNMTTAHDENNHPYLTPSNIVEISGKHKSPQANSPLFIVDNKDAPADILCYPPNVSVPYWSRIIFRNFDYTINTKENNDFSSVLTYNEDITLSTSAFQFDLQGNIDTVEEEDKPDYVFNNCLMNNGSGTFTGKITKWDKANVFLRFDEYPSRSKVIFAGCDKTRNPDIEFNFGYQKGQMEPIKLNLSLSAGVPMVDHETPYYKYNQSLNYVNLQKVFSSCYWCIEWICDKDAGN